MALPQWATAVVYLLLLAVALYPVFSVDVLPLVDYPNHLARLYVLTAIDDVPALKERYAVDWDVLPNLAMDAFVVLLAGWLSIFDSLRLFVALTLVLIVAGSLSLHRVLFGRISLLPTAVYLLLYNHVLIFGFVNYLFAVGLYLLAFAGWIASARWPTWWRLVAFSAASVVLFFAHLFALGVYGLSVAAYELWRTREARGKSLRQVLENWAVTSAQFVVPAILWLASPTGDRDNYIAYGEIKHKIAAFTSPILCYGELIDQAMLVIVGILLVRGLFSGTLKIAADSRYPLIILSVVAVLMPAWLLGIWGADMRLPLVIACLLAATTRLELRSVRIGLVVASVGLALFGIRVWTITETWQSYDSQFSEFRRASQAIERGARLLVVQLDRNTDATGTGHFDLVYWHMPALAVIDRSVFLPYLFTDPTTQPVRAAEAYAAIDTPYGHPIPPDLLRKSAHPEAAKRIAGLSFPAGYKPFWANWPQNFDYVLFVHFGADENPMPGLLRHLHSGSFFALYEVVETGSR